MIGSFYDLSKSLLFSKRVSFRSLFLQTFCESIFMNFKIIVGYYLQISKLSFLELLSLLVIPVMIKLIFPERVKIAAYIIITFIV